MDFMGIQPEELVGKLPLLLGSAAWIKQRHLHRITNVSYEML